MVVMLSMLASVVLGQDSFQNDDESVLLQAARITKAGVGYRNQRADPVDACKDSDGVSIKQLDSRMKEDCTHNDFHIWHSDSKSAPTYKPGEYAEDDAWRTVKVQEEDGWQSSCVAFVETNQTSCTDWCGVHGLQCVKAMDNAAGREANLRTWFEAEDYAVSQCSLGEHWEAGKIADITGYASTHGCDVPLNSQICACDTTTTTTTADAFVCDNSVNFIVGDYVQIALTDACPNCSANPIYGESMGETYDSNLDAHAVAKALEYCKAECMKRSDCTAFFFQKHGNGHEICGFYSDTVNLASTVRHSHQACSQVCIRGSYSVGQYKAKTAMGMQTEPTCQNNASPVPSVASCQEYAKSVGQYFQIGDLPNYPRGCSHRQKHPSHAGVWWNTDQTGDWDQHPGFTGEVALVCISPEPITTSNATCNDPYVEALTAYWEYGNCGHFGNDYNKGLCGGIKTGDCPEFWSKPEDSQYIVFAEAEMKYPGISEKMNCVKARRKSFVKSPAFIHNRIYTSEGKGNTAEGITLNGAECDADCRYLWHAQYECVEFYTSTMEEPRAA